MHSLHLQRQGIFWPRRRLGLEKTQNPAISPPCEPPSLDTIIGEERVLQDIVNEELAQVCESRVRAASKAHGRDNNVRA